MNFTTGGGLALIAGSAMVQQQLYRRLYDALGALLFEPTRGAGLSSWIGRPLSPADQAAIAQTVSDQCLQHHAVQSVENVTVTQQGQGVLVVAPSVVLVGQAQVVTLPMQFTQAPGSPGPLVPAPVTGVWVEGVWVSGVWV
jgi:phage baseplate assembly protein W